jgi:DNA-binding transcriptional ArsR family regulator
MLRKDQTSLAALAARLARLEEAVKHPKPSPRATKPRTAKGDGRTEAQLIEILQHLAAKAPKGSHGGGALLLAGTVTAGGRQYTDLRNAGVHATLDQLEQRAAVLAAIASAPRLRLLRRLVAADASRTDLLAELEGSSAGQLYHHLKELSRVGLITQPERGVFRLRPDKVVPLIAVLAAAMILADGGESAGW